MPELRKDPILGAWVIIARERAKRPSDFARRPPEKRKGQETCPFCYGREDQTPPEVLAYRPAEGEPNTPGWSVRVVPNKFPALDPQEQLFSREVGPFTLLSGRGVHEVIIETPEHEASLVTYPREQLELVWRAIIERYQALARDPDLRYIQIFKNHGALAGASLEHPHFQLVATPLIPPLIQQELDASYRYYTARHRCIYCDVIELEERENQRTVEKNESFLIFCPYASRAPFEFWLLPRRHKSHFFLLTPSELRDLASILQEIMGRLVASLADPPFNLMLHTAPVDLEPTEYYHWHLEVVPRLTVWAGFELGTGVYINPTPPEVAAKFLQVSLRDIH